MVDQYHLSNPRLLNYTLTTASLTGFASAVSGASWTLTATTVADGAAHRVTVQNNSANDKSSISIAVVGTDANGNALSETLTGPTGSATVTTTGYFKTLTSVTPASTWGADTANIGWAAQIQTPILNINLTAEDALVVNVDISGTITYTVQQTFDDINAASPVWQTLVAAGSQTADGIWNTTGGATGLRVTVASYSAGATIRVNANPTAMINAPGAGGGGGGGGTNVNVASWGGTATTLGQKAMTASVPVVIASDQSTVSENVASWGGTSTTLGQKASTASVPVVLASDQSGIIGLAYGGAKVAVTRPNDTTPYGALDVVGGAFEITSMGPSAGRIMLTSTQFEWDVSSIPSGATSFFLALYNVTPPSAYADNTTWDLPSGDRASFLGIVQLGTPVDLGSTLYIEQNIVNKQIKLAGTSLFAYCVTQTGYTPTAQSVQQFTLHSVGLGY